MNTFCRDSKIDKRRIFRSVHALPADEWNAVAQGRNVYLSLPYLRALQASMSHEMEFFYSISYDAQGKPLLIAAFQLVKFIDKRRQYTVHLCKLSYHITKKISDAMNINVLVCGNVFSDGENGFLWSDVLSAEDAIEEVDEVVDTLTEDKEIKEKMSITLFKEFFPRSTTFSDRLKKRHYRDFRIDVNMVLKMEANWKNLQDYLDSMKTKFRTRLKSVYAKSAGLEIKEFSAEDILAQCERVELLFGNVRQKSDFSFGTLNAEAFAAFKRELGELFTFRGLFLGEELVGFSTAFCNGGRLEANYVGLDYHFNQEYAVYQRILCDYVEQAIARKSDELHLGRTAELMKSSIGALPTDMKLYVKHRKSVPNLLLKPLVHSIAPSEFEIRQPFKTSPV